MSLKPSNEAKMSTKQSQIENASRVRNGSYIVVLFFAQFKCFLSVFKCEESAVKSAED